MSTVDKESGLILLVAKQLYSPLFSSFCPRKRVSCCATTWPLGVNHCKLGRGFPSARQVKLFPKIVIWVKGESATIKIAVFPNVYSLKNQYCDQLHKTRATIITFANRQRNTTKRSNIGKLIHCPNSNQHDGLEQWSTR